MLIRASQLTDFTIHATDGDIGTIEELYFDDEKWTIRYLIVNTGSWFSGKEVLISPVFLVRADSEKKQLDLSLTKEQIENSPGIDTDRPVSRQHEAEYMNYYGYPYYWDGSDVWGSGPLPAGLVGSVSPLEPRTVVPEHKPEDSHLRSSAAVTGYHVEASDGLMGRVADFIVDLDTWSVHYLEVNTNYWWPGKKVLVAPEWIVAVSWLDSKISVNLLRETIKSAPEYIESKKITRDYELQLHEHYGRQVRSRSRTSSTS